MRPHLSNLSTHLLRPVALNFHAPYVMFLNGRSSARQQGSAPRQTGLQPLWTDAPAVIALFSGQYPGDGMNAYDIVSEQCAAWGQLRNRTAPWQISGDAAHPVMLFPVSSSFVTPFVPVNAPACMPGACSGCIVSAGLSGLEKLQTALSGIRQGKKLICRRVQKTVL